MRIEQIIIHSNLSKMKNKIHPTCLQGNYRDSLGDFSNISYGVFWGGRGLSGLTAVKLLIALAYRLCYR